MMRRFLQVSSRRYDFTAFRLPHSTLSRAAHGVASPVTPLQGHLQRLDLDIVASVLLMPAIGSAEADRHVSASLAIMEAQPGVRVTSHALGATLEGSWDDVMDAVKSATLEMHAAGIARVTTTLSCRTRTDTGVDRRLHSLITN